MMFAKPAPASSSPTTYRARSIPPDGGGCIVEIIELPQAKRYREVFAFLQAGCPALVPEDRWRLAIQDAIRFFARWSLKAERLGWSSADLLGLAPVPDNPSPSYNRLARYDGMGLCWLLQGKRVTSLSETEATIRNPKTGSII